ncbi:MAG: double-strand break repair protein AddB [Boseongicola sp.]|nr:double-strand break repair protein AddB [Boseongicola sp.]
MFDPTDKPRVFGVPPGADFPTEIVNRCLNAYRNQPPEALARLHIIVNTERMRRRLIELFSDGSPRLLPRITLVTAIDRLTPSAPLPPATSKLHRKLELARLIKPLLESPDAPAPRSALFDLSDSLASLLDELHGESVDPDKLLSLEVQDESNYWRRSLEFLSIVKTYIDQSGTSQADPDARLRAATEALLSLWANHPPQTPVLVVGSTGSRGTTFDLMTAVARLPQGAVVLPGFDPDTPDDVWSTLTESDTTSTGFTLEDHPQYRFAKLAKALDINPKNDIPSWADNAPDPLRNKLVSLSLRPAPVTNQWRTEGPEFTDLAAATKGLALIEAPQPRDEALAIASALREAVANGETAALITPDRTLGRRVAAALSRWNIVPDDSAGRPLSLTPPGRFLRHVLSLLQAESTSENVIALLKHPITRTDGTDRGDHLRATREFELFLRHEAAVTISDETLDAFVHPDRKPEFADWAAWLKTTLAELSTPAPETLGDAINTHIAIAQSIAQGPDGTGTGELWEKEAGRDALQCIETLRDPKISETPLSLHDYRALFETTLAAGNTRATETSHPNVLIWGTLEARVMGVDLAILGGLNEGVWPARPDPDPWLSRKMRRTLGLLTPEREIGLSAHDYQQAIAAPRVILSRARRDDDAETVPARWINRLTNLLTGLAGEDPEAPISQMRARGNHYLRIATQLDAPDSIPEPAVRPAPAPPINTRTRSYTVTDIEKLIRDPYAIYARYTLRLKALQPLRPEPNAAMRGTVFHKIAETFLASPLSDPSADTNRFLEIAQAELSKNVPWPSVRAQWFGHLSAIAEAFIADEIRRQSQATPLGQEIIGSITLPGSVFHLRGKADRIDQRPDGQLIIYDYKTGSPPSEREMRYYKRQLLVEAVMAEHGAFKDIPATKVARVDHIGLNRALKQTGVDLDFYQASKSEQIDYRTTTVETELRRLLEHFRQETQGYMSRRAMERVRFSGDFDHLARFGEWDETQDPVKVTLK